MKRWGLLCVLLLSLATARGQDDVWYTDPEAPPQIQTLSANDFDSVVASQGVTVVHFMVTKTDDASVKKMRTVNKQMMQGAAQGADSDTVFAEVEMAGNEELCEKHGVTAPNTVLVFKNGRKAVYQGYRAPDVLLSFIKKVGSPVINVINNKADKKAFDKLPVTKVIGYFDSVSPAYQTFKEAAEHFYPEIPFYAVLDPLVAGQIKLTTPGEVGLVIPPTKQAVLPTAPLATLEDYKVFVGSAKDPLLQQITPDIFHALLSSAGTDPFVIAFVRQMAPESKPLYKALKSLAKGQHASLPVKLLDVDQFPMLEKQLTQKFQLDVTQPALGLFNMTDGTSSWFNMSQFEAVADKYQRMALLLDWLLDVQLGNIRVDGQPSANVPKPVIDLGTEEAAKKKENKEKEALVQEEVKTTEKLQNTEKTPIPAQEGKTKKIKKFKGNKNEAKSNEKKNKDKKTEGESTPDTKTAKSQEGKTTTETKHETKPAKLASKLNKKPEKAKKEENAPNSNKQQENAKDKETLKTSQKKKNQVEEKRNKKQQKQNTAADDKQNKKKNKREQQKNKEHEELKVDRETLAAKESKRPNKERTKKENDGTQKNNRDGKQDQKVNVDKKNKRMQEKRDNTEKKKTEWQGTKDQVVHKVDKKQNKKKKMEKM